MQTKRHCATCGYQIYNNQSWERNAANMVCHADWHGCQESIAKGDDRERDGELRWKHMRRRDAGLHFQ